MIIVINQTCNLFELNWIETLRNTLEVKCAIDWTRRFFTRLSGKQQVNDKSLLIDVVHPQTFLWLPFVPFVVGLLDLKQR